MCYNLIIKDNSKDEWKLERRFQNKIMANKLTKRCSKSLVIREMQIETTETYFHVPSRITKLKSCENTKCC